MLDFRSSLVFGLFLKKRCFANYFFCILLLTKSAVCNVYTMSRSVLGLNTTPIVNFLNYLKKNFTVYLAILSLIFNLQDILAKNIGRKI